MSARPRPTIRLRRLAGTLCRLRAERELSRDYVSEKTGINPATLYRIETARARPQVRTLDAILTVYEVTDDQRTALMKLLRDAAFSGLLQPYTEDLPEEYTTYIEFEEDARAVWNYQSLLIPGLLQTEAYARAVIPGTVPSLTRAQVDQRVTVRMKRQKLLRHKKPLELWVICDEAALHRAVGGPKVMRDQLLHLIDAMELPNVTLQVVEFGAGAHPGMPGSFIVMNFSDDPQVVHVDSMAGDLFLEEEADLRRYSGLYEHLRALAMSPDATRRLLTRVAGEYQARGASDG